MITWQKIGCVEVAELPDGKTGLVWDADDGTLTPIEWIIYIPNSGGDIDCDHCPTIEEAKQEVEFNRIPKPIDYGPNHSFWRSKDGVRTAYVSGIKAEWCVSKDGGRVGWFASREQAEAAAAKYVRGGK